MNRWFSLIFVAVTLTSCELGTLGEHTIVNPTTKNSIAVGATTYLVSKARLTDVVDEGDGYYSWWLELAQSDVTIDSDGILGGTGFAAQVAIYTDSASQTGTFTAEDDFDDLWLAQFDDDDETDLYDDSPSGGELQITTSGTNIKITGTLSVYIDEQLTSVKIDYDGGYGSIDSGKSIADAHHSTRFRR